MADTITVLTVADVVVQQDTDGRFSLNDLHRAAGGEDRNKPGHWLQTQRSKDLIAALSTGGIPPVETRQGNAGGTFVVWELVYDYAMWISAPFGLQVIRGYHASVTGSAALQGTGAAGQPLSVPGIMAAQRQVQRLLTAVLDAKNAAVRRVNYGLLASNLRLLGEPVPSLADLVLDRDPSQPELPGMKGGAA